MAVVVQPMIDADAAGVMFTANPLNGASNEIHVEAIWGLGEAVITARRMPDHFIVSKINHTLETRAIATKSVMERVAPEGGLVTIGVPTDKQETACLSDEQVLALAEIGKRVETHFQTPQDIEWCCADGKILLLQTRPLVKR